MDKLHIKVALDEGAFMPTKAYDADAGFDMRTPQWTIILGGRNRLIDTGVHLDIPKGYCGIIKTKSGLNTKHGLRSAAGVIDSGYTGSVKVNIFNDSSEAYVFEVGDKIAQIVFVPIPDVVLDKVESLNSDTPRGNNGFGSTGK